MLGNAPMAKPVFVFVDSQNSYMRARAIFDLKDADYTYGQTHPIKVARLITQKLGISYNLLQVRVYRGLPSNKFDPKGYGAVRKQTAIWRKSEKVEVILRPIHYPRNWPNSLSNEGLPREKGIDVQLAIDFVRFAIAGKFEAGIILSMDNDLKPALEFVGKEFPDIEIGVASWWPEGVITKRNRPSTISVPGVKLRNLRLGIEDFQNSRDDTDYSR
jgi:NYN domain